MAKRKNADEEFQNNGANKKVRVELNTNECDQGFVLTKEIVENEILSDLSQNKWRVGKPIGKGSFGEIFLASNDITKPVTSENAKYVVKIEPHSNGPLFVEIHCLINTGKATETKPLPPGMPQYIASGSHYFQNSRYRFLILHRYKCDLHSLIKNQKVDPKCVLVIASQIIDVLEHFHDKGYAHSDIKSENLMIGSCTYTKNANACFKRYNIDRKKNDEFSTPNRSVKLAVEFSGSNPMRSCRNSRKTSIYEDMLKTHYLRPSKKINYNEDFDDEDFIPKKKFDTNASTCSVSDSSNVMEDRIFLIDFGLASKFVDSNGNHRPFCMDQRRAHDGTLEFTSRDAHMGAHSRRSDLECLGYNLIYWCQGTLPWKDEKLLQQPEQVHHMKEYFMTDVKFMLQQIYGRSVSKFLGEFMSYVGHLAYDQRPDYGFCKYIFNKALIAMGKNPDKMTLNIEEIKQNVKSVSNDTENASNILKHAKSILSLGMLLPFKEQNGASKVSPKNLRSKTDKIQKKQKQFSWTEILSTDPDQIARQRAEKEYERDQSQPSPDCLKYKGRPTYAIIEMENKIKNKEKDDSSNDIVIKGYNKPMMDILRKRQMYIIQQIEDEKEPDSDTEHSSSSNDSVTFKIKRNEEKTKRRPGLRKTIIPTKRSLNYKKSIAIKNKRTKYSTSESDLSRSSCNDDMLFSSNSCAIPPNSSLSSFSEDYYDHSNDELNTCISNKVSDTTNEISSPAPPALPIKRGRGRPKRKKNLFKKTNKYEESKQKERSFSRG